MKQAGLAEAIADAITSLPESLQGLFWANVTLVGGNTLLPGFTERLRRDLVSWAPSEYFVRIRRPEDPVTFPFECIRHHLNLDKLPYRSATHIRDRFVTRAEYLEHGSNICRSKFASAPLSSDWQPPAAVMREADEDEESESVSSGHSEEMARKRARRAKEEAGRPKKKKKDVEARGFRVKI